MNTFKVISSIFSLLDRKLKLFGILLFLLLLLVSFVETFSIASISPVISSLNNQENDTVLLPIFNYLSGNDINSKFKLMVCSLFLFSILKTFSLHLLNNFGYKVTSWLEYIILTSDLNRINQRFSSDWKAELNASLTGRIDCTKDSIIKCMVIISSSISITLIILINALTHPLLILYVACTLVILYFLISLMVKNKLKNNSKIIAKGKFNRINITKEIINYKREILISGLSKNATNKFLNNTRKLRRAEAFGDTISELPKTWIESIALSIILSSGLYFLKDNANAISAIGVLAVSGQKIITYLQAIFSSITLIRNSSEDVQIISKQVNENKNFYASINLDYKFVSLEIRWDQIKNKNGEISNLIINKGDKILISGESGSGKTMLMESILGIEICKDISLSCFLENSDRKSLSIIPSNLTSYIPQESYLNDGSILDNILFFQDNFNVDKVKDIYEICGLQTICKFNDLKNYRIGEGGKILSGGQRQRVALARAIYMNREILLIDEATSALDRESERKILTKLINYYKSKTILCISHNNFIQELFKKKFLVIKNKHK